MINFVLYNNCFANFLLGLTIINFVLILFLKNNNKKDSIICQENLNKEELSKNIIINIWFAIFFIVFCFLIYFYKNFYITLIYIAIFISIFRVIKNYTKDSLKLNFDSIISYVFVSWLFSVFFSSNSADVYVSSFSSLPHIIKEILLISFLTFKINFFTFFTLINISIFISIIEEFLGIIIKKVFSFIKAINFNHKLIYYNFNISKGNYDSFLFKIDMVIHFFTCPIFIILNLLLILIKYLFGICFTFIYRLYEFFINFNNNRKSIIEFATKISLLISLVYVYISIIYNPSLFSTEIKEVFNLIATVILIPIIYDSLKNKVFSKNN